MRHALLFPVITLSLVAQAPTPAVAGIQALGMLAGKGIDAWIASKANKDDEGD